MKKYYVLDKESQISKDYLKWKQEQFKINDAFRKLVSELGIETTEYYPTVGRLHIVPTRRDREKFQEEFMKNSNGLFKIGSKTNKAWVEEVKNKDIHGYQKPRLFLYFNARGSWSECLLEIDGTVYATFDSESEFECKCDSFHEIKASEYHKIIEDYEEKQRQEGIRCLN